MRRSLLSRHRLFNKMINQSIQTLPPFYCTICDVYFATIEERGRHIQESDKHPSCDKCIRRFANNVSLRNHWTLSEMHNYCSGCEIDFRTAAGFRAHVEFSVMHQITDDDDDDDSDDEKMVELDWAPGWEDDLGPYFFPDEDLIAARRRGDLTIFQEEPDEDIDVGQVADESSCNSAEDELDLSDTECSMLAYDPCDHQHHQHATSGDSDLSSILVAGNLTSDSVNSKQPAYTCPLCLEIPVKCLATKCGHVFCGLCLTRALTLKNMCPMCRTPVLPRELRRISGPSDVLSES